MIVHFPLFLRLDGEKGCICWLAVMRLLHLTTIGDPDGVFGNGADRYGQDSETFGGLTDLVRCILDILLAAMHYNQ